MLGDRTQPAPPRPQVSVVVPFHGTPAEAAELLDALALVELAPGDETIVVDNSGAGAVPEREGVRVLRADREHSAYYARNVGADAAGGEWLLFADSDCRPQADIVARYLAAPIADTVGAVVGEVEGEAGQHTLVARYARSRGHLAQHYHVNHPFRPWGVTANLLVRRAAWASVGGFQEGVRSAGDTEFSWRLQDAGWEIGYRPAAVVAHRHRETTRKLARQSARYGAGRAWVSRRYPGALPRPTLVAPLARAVAGVAVWTVAGRFERARFKALDGLYVASRWGAYLLSNTPPVRASANGTAPAAAVAAAFPALDEPEAVAAVRELGAGVRIEARARPVRVDRDAARSLPIAWAEDDGTLRRTGAAAALALRSPRRVARYATGRRPGEPPLLELATRAQRLRQAGVRRVHAVGSGAEGDAAALARLLGLDRG